MSEDDSERKAQRTGRQRASLPPGATGMDPEALALARLARRPGLGGGAYTRRVPPRLPEGAPVPGTHAWEPAAPRPGRAPIVDRTPSGETERPGDAGVPPIVDRTPASQPEHRPAAAAPSIVDRTPPGKPERPAAGTDAFDSADPLGVGKGPADDGGPSADEIMRDDLPDLNRTRPIKGVIRPTRAVGAATSKTPVPAPDPERVAELRKAWAARMQERNPKQQAVAVLGDEHGLQRTEKTVREYTRRGEQMAKRYRRETGMKPDDEINPVDFATWFVSLRVSIKPGTWRYYKQCVILMLNRLPGNEVQEAVEIVEAEASFEGEMDVTPRKRKPQGTEGRKKRSSADKSKHFELASFERLDIYLQMGGVWSDLAYTLRAWLRAGLATGLRPDEWQATQVVTMPDPSHPRHERIYLFVLNAKSTNGRANGKARTLEITDFTQETLNAVMHMSETGYRWALDGLFDEKQSQCAQILYRADARIWGKRSRAYSLYSCRHQFVLNMRELQLPEEEISALMGHQVTETQLVAYGKRGKGWSVDKIVDRPRPIQSEVATVRKTLLMAEQRRRLEAILNLRKPKRSKPQDDGAPPETAEAPDLPEAGLPAEEF